MQRPRHYEAESFFAPWVNARGRARAKAADLRRALSLFMAFGLLLADAAALSGMVATS
ncbi:MAG: hypothetical protein U1E97_11425 [Alphaproteobacteria bacterium]